MIGIGIISHGVACLAFLSLTLMLLVSRRKNERSGSLVLASALSTLWALIATLQSTNPVLFLAFGGTVDGIRILAWAYFLHSVLAQPVSASGPVARESVSPVNAESITDFKKSAKPPSNAWVGEKGIFRFPVFALILFTTHLALWWASNVGALATPLLVRLIATLWVLISLAALLRLERFIRATPPENRGAIRYLWIGLGTMFLFDFIVFTDTQLFSRINTDLWFARGFVYAMVVPLIALAIARNPHWSVTLHVSRQAVTSSITAMAAGVYLLTTALAAYFVRFSGVEWASVAQIVLILVALVLFVLLAFSATIRSRLRVFVSKHLFNFKYDYRLEWLNFTDTLASHIGDTPNAVLQGLTGLVKSDGGILWRLTSQRQIEIIASNGSLSRTTIDESDAAVVQQFSLQKQWLIDLDEVREHPDKYEGMTLSTPLLEHSAAWLILPLMFRDELVACLMFARSSVQKDINWEDRDLLKTAGRQAATLLKQELTQSKLAEASQFQAFSKLSAYIVHDLKNIIGQQSLLVSNAARHKHNPEFVDDVITTVDNSVKRMQALLEQLRAKPDEEEEHVSSVDVVEALKNVLSSRGNRRPVPELDAPQHLLNVHAEPERLQRVFGHLVQNAQEATSADGSVSIVVRCDETHAIVEVRDTGSGMTQDFIRNRLFKAFESTKGLTGMGIGVFESREYVNSLGGDLSVSSEPGVGTILSVRLPLAGGGV